MIKQTPTPPKTSNRQQARDLSARLETVEKNLQSFEEAIPQFMFATDRAISVLQNQQSHATEIQNALVAILGQDAVIEKIKELRIAAEVKKAEERRARVAKALEEGKIVPEETVRPCVLDEKQKGPDDKPLVVDEGSIISLVEFGPDGDEIPYSFACVPVYKLSKETYREKLTGQKVGFEWEIEFEDEEGKPNGKKGKAVLMGVYKRVPQKPAAAPEAPVAAVPDETPAAPETPEVAPEAVPTPVAETTPAVAQA